VVVLRLSVVTRAQAIGLLATKGIPLRIAADREKGRASWNEAGLPAQSLPRRRFRRALRAFICTFCMRVCIYVYVCMCADMYIYIYVHVCMYMYMYAFIHMCMCMCMHICAWIVSLSISASACGRCHACACVFVYICMRVHMGVGIYICAFIAESVACTLEQVFWTLLHGQVCTLHRCVFTPTYTSANTLAAGCAHMCIFIYLCICMHMCMDAYARL